MCLGVWPVYKPVHQCHAWCLSWSEEGTTFPELQLQIELPCWCWKSILGPLGEQPVYLTTEQTLQPTTLLTIVAL